MGYCRSISKNELHVGQIDEIDHDLDHLVGQIDKTDHVLDHLVGQIDQIDHDLDHLDTYLPL